MDSNCWLPLRPHRDSRVLPGSLSIVVGLSEDCLKIKFAEGVCSSCCHKILQRGAERLVIWVFR